MFHSNDRNELRKSFFEAWQKHLQKKPLLPLEQQLADVIADHPEYHSLFDNEEQNLDKDFTPEMGQSNPFLHMSLHLAIRDQVATNRPPGITITFNKLATKLRNKLEAEHLMMNVLAETLWTAQRNNSMPDEQAFLESCKNLL